MSDNSASQLDPNDRHLDPDGYDSVEAYGPIMFVAMIFMLVTVAFTWSQVLERGLSFGEFVPLGICAAISVAVAQMREIRLKAHKEKVRQARYLESTSSMAALIETQKGILQQLSDMGHDIVINNVTVTLGQGATFSGPLVVGRNMIIAYTQAADAKNNALGEILGELVKVVSQLAESVGGDEQYKISENLKAFVSQASNPRPVENLLRSSADSLIKAAQLVSQFIVPVSNSISSVMKLLGM